MDTVTRERSRHGMVALGLGANEDTSRVQDSNNDTGSAPKQSYPLLAEPSNYNEGTVPLRSLENAMAQRLD